MHNIWEMATIKSYKNFIKEQWKMAKIKIQMMNNSKKILFKANNIKIGTKFKMNSTFRRWIRSILFQVLGHLKASIILMFIVVEI